MKFFVPLSRFGKPARKFRGTPLDYTLLRLPPEKEGN